MGACAEADRVNAVAAATVVMYRTVPTLRVTCSSSSATALPTRCAARRNLRARCVAAR